MSRLEHKSKGARSQLEMIYRGLYYFHSASSRGEADDPVKYFAAPDNQKCLGIVKRERKPKGKLIVAQYCSVRIISLMVTEKKSQSSGVSPQKS